MDLGGVGLTSMVLVWMVVFDVEVLSRKYYAGEQLALVKHLGF